MLIRRSVEGLTMSQSENSHSTPSEERRLISDRTLEMQLIKLCESAMRDVRLVMSLLYSLSPLQHRRASLAKMETMLSTILTQLREFQPTCSASLDTSKSSSEKDSTTVLTDFERQYGPGTTPEMLVPYPTKLSSISLGEDGLTATYYGDSK